MLNSYKSYIALRVVVIKLRHRELTVRVFRTVHAAPGEEARQLCNGNAVKLLMEDVVDALLQVGYLRLQPGDEPFCNFTQKHSRLAGWVYVPADFDTIEKALSGANIPKKA